MVLGGCLELWRGLEGNEVMGGRREGLLKLWCGCALTRVYQTWGQYSTFFPLLHISAASVSPRPCIRIHDEGGDSDGGGGSNGVREILMQEGIQE